MSTALRGIEVGPWSLDAMAELNTRAFCAQRQPVAASAPSASGRDDGFLIEAPFASLNQTRLPCPAGNTLVHRSRRELHPNCVRQAVVGVAGTVLLSARHPANHCEAP